MGQHLGLKMLFVAIRTTKIYHKACTHHSAKSFSCSSRPVCCYYHYLYCYCAGKKNYPCRMTPEISILVWNLVSYGWNRNDSAGERDQTILWTTSNSLFSNKLYYQCLTAAEIINLSLKKTNKKTRCSVCNVDLHLCVLERIVSFWRASVQSTIDLIVS